MANNQIMTLGRGTNIVDLYSWSHGSFNHGYEALEGTEGFGLPPVLNRYFEGAGDGAIYRGSRVLPRVLLVPLVAHESNRAGLDLLLSRLAVILAPDRSTPSTLRYTGPDTHVWYLEVVREDGGDYIRKTLESDRKTYFKTHLGLKAGDPYWTREDAESFTLQQDASGRGLLPYLAKLEVSSGKVFGTLTPENTGDAPAWPMWTIGGPITSLTLTGPKGEVLSWSGSITVGQKLIIDTKRGTIVDQAGVNRYNELGPAPQFWSIPADEAPISISTGGTTGTTYITAEWKPRKWSMI